MLHTKVQEIKFKMPTTLFCILLHGSSWDYVVQLLLVVLNLLVLLFFGWWWWVFLGGCFLPSVVTLCNVIGHSQLLLPSVKYGENIYKGVITQKLCVIPVLPPACLNCQQFFSYIIHGQQTSLVWLHVAEANNWHPKCQK